MPLADISGETCVCLTSGGRQALVSPSYGIPHKGYPEQLIAVEDHLQAGTWPCHPWRRGRPQYIDVRVL